PLALLKPVVGAPPYAAIAWVPLPLLLSPHASAATADERVSPSSTAPAVRWLIPSAPRSRAPHFGQRTSRAKAWHEQEGQAMSLGPMGPSSWIDGRVVKLYLRRRGGRSR